MTASAITFLAAFLAILGGLEIALRYQLVLQSRAVLRFADLTHGLEDRLIARRWARWSLGAFVYLVALAGAWLWFGRYHSHALMGDDLVTWLRERSTPGWAAGLRAVLDPVSQKYRPVSNLLQLVSYHAFGVFYGGYKDLNLVIEAANVTLFARLAWLLSKSRLLTVGLAAVALTAQFNLYYVMQGFGGEEGLSITFLLLALLAARRGLHGETRGVFGASLAYAAAIYTYEGMLAAGLMLVLLPLVADRGDRAWRRDLAWRLGWSMAPVLVAGSNVVVKSALGVHFLKGTAGTNIALSVSSVATFFWQGVETLMGFSAGPDYLSGASWNQLPHSEGLLLGIGFAGILLLLAFATVVRIVTTRRKEKEASRVALFASLRIPLLGIALALPLLVTACVTIRQEYRWLYAPYLLLLLGVAWAFGFLRPATSQLSLKVVWVMCCAVVVAVGLSMEVAYRPYAWNTYFFSAQAGADSVYQQVFVADATRLSNTTILIDTKGDPVFTSWIMIGGDFFSLYADGRPLDVRLIPSAAAVRLQKHLRSHVQLLVWNGSAVVPTPLPSRA